MNSSFELRDYCDVTVMLTLKVVVAISLPRFITGRQQELRRRRQSPQTSLA
jgi:hypothetical protein